MFVKRGSNRRAQEGVTLTTLLLIVLGVVVVAVVIWGATGGFNFIFSKFNVIPGQSLESVIQGCNIAGEGSLKGDFCLTFKKVTMNGVDQYVTCDSDSIFNNLEANAKNSQLCDADKTVKALQFCTAGATIKGSDLNKILVNGRTCVSYFGVDLTQSSCDQTPGGSVELKQTIMDTSVCDQTTVGITDNPNPVPVIMDVTSLMSKYTPGKKRCCLVYTPKTA